MRGGPCGTLRMLNLLPSLPEFSPSPPLLTELTHWDMLGPLSQPPLLLLWSWVKEAGLAPMRTQERPGMPLAPFSKSEKLQHKPFPISKSPWHCRRFILRREKQKATEILTLTKAAIWISAGKEWSLAHCCCEMCEGSGCSQVLSCAPWSLPLTPGQLTLRNSLASVHLFYLLVIMFMFINKIYILKII